VSFGYTRAETTGEEAEVKRLIALAALLPLVLCCSTAPRMEWQRADAAGDPEAMREQRAKDLADCATVVGAPTQNEISGGSLSREQAKDCMRAKGWRQVPVSEP
jgi:type VI protein secretion system component VasK